MSYDFKPQLMRVTPPPDSVAQLNTYVYREMRRQAEIINTLTRAIRELQEANPKP